MSKSVKVEFVDGGRIRLATNFEDDGAQAAVKAAALNILSVAGEDRVFPDRGTSLGWRSSINQLFQSSGASAAATFAALDTVFFMRQSHRHELEDLPEEIFLHPSEVSADSIDLEMSYNTAGGETLSYPQNQ